MKYNLSKIMTQAHSLRAQDSNLTMSHALKIAWIRAKLSILNAVSDEYFLLQMKDMWDAEDRRKAEAMNRTNYSEINALNLRIREIELEAKAKANKGKLFRSWDMTEITDIEEQRKLAPHDHLVDALGNMIRDIAA